jgi:hypothetical protein
MKYFLLTIIILIPVIIHAKSRPKIAVMEITADTVSDKQNYTTDGERGRTTDNAYAKLIRNKIELSLYSSGNYELLERNSIQIIMKEHGLMGAAYENTDFAIKAGQYLSADFVIVGSISNLEGYTLSIKIVNIKKGNILFIGAKTYTDKNDYIKYTLILTEEIKTAIEKHDKDDEISFKKKEDRAVLFNILLSGGVSLPLFTWESISKTGYNIKLQSYIELKNKPAITAGLSIGYLSNELKDASGIAHGIPVMVNIGYSFHIKEILAIVPQFQVGINYSILQMNEKTWQSVEPVIAPGLIISLNLSKNIYVLISADWSFIFETTGTVQSININAGLGFNI